MSTTDQKRINPTPTFISDFSLSSDGKIVLYTKRLFNPDMHTEVWKINIDGSNDTQIDTAPDIFGVFTTPYSNYAVYSKRNNEKYIGYWLNLDNLSKETIEGESNFIFWPEFL